MRDVALNLFWVNRFAMTMYEKVPTRWRDVPRTRGDVYLPVVQPWQDKEGKVSAVENAYDELPSGGDPETEDRIWELLFDVFGNRKHHASALEAIRPTVAQALQRPDPADLPAGHLRPRLPDVLLHRHRRLSRRMSPNWRRCTGGRWCCTTSTRGTGPTCG